MACKKLDAEGLDFRLNITIDGHNTDKIKYLGKISKEEVYRNYQNSCLVFPSYIETFGYPLVEAKSCGALILASDCEFSHELLDDYPNAYFFNPFKMHELFNLMKSVLEGNVVKTNVKSDSCNVLFVNTWTLVIDEILRVSNANIK